MPLTPGDAGGKSFSVTLLSAAGALFGATLNATVEIHAAGNVAGSGAPAAAAAVGYTTLTFGPAVTLNDNWYPWNFYGSGTPPADVATQNPDGSLFISGDENNTYGSSVSSAYETSSSSVNWKGTAFGGGAYFEAVASFTGQGDGPYANGGPAFWALDIEHTSNGPYIVNWPGQALTYDDYFEVDFMQYDAGAYAYQTGIGNWYGDHAAGTFGSTSNPVQAVPVPPGSVLVPSGTNSALPLSMVVCGSPRRPVPRVICSSSSTARRWARPSTGTGTILPIPSRRLRWTIPPPCQAWISGTCS